MAPHEHDDDAVSPFRPSHVHEPWPYVCASRRSRPCPYVRMWPYFLSCTLAAIRTCTCYVRASTMTRARLYIDQYVRTRSRLEWQCYVRFDQVGPDCQALPCLRRCSWWVPAVRGKGFFREIRWPVRWVPLSGGGIIILRVIRRHFLAASVDPAVSLSMYSPCLMEAVP